MILIYFLYVNSHQITRTTQHKCMRILMNYIFIFPTEIRIPKHLKKIQGFEKESEKKNTIFFVKSDNSF